MGFAWSVLWIIAVMLDSQGRMVFMTVSGKELQQRVESLMAISLWSGDIILPLSDGSPADGIDMDDEDGDDV